MPNSNYLTNCLIAVAVQRSKIADCSCSARGLSAEPKREGDGKFSSFSLLSLSSVFKVDLFCCAIATYINKFFSYFSSV